MAIVLDGVGTVNGVTLPTTGFGKVLQVVRATDTTSRETTSTSLVDANISVTITPQKNTSAIMLIWVCRLTSDSATTVANFRVSAVITDSANVAISGAEQSIFGYYGNTSFSAPGLQSQQVFIGYATPATTSAVTYKGRFRCITTNTRVSVENVNNTGQLYAIEVSA